MFDIQVWWLKVDELLDQDVRHLHSMLDSGERMRAGLFRHSSRRVEFITAHALVRGLLSFRTGISALAWRFRSGPWRRPELDTRYSMPPLQISLSHTRGLAIAAVAEDYPVGIDAEWLGRPRSFDWLVDFLYASGERRKLAAMPGAYRMRASLALWTFKEAYSKATGRGLFHPSACHQSDVAKPALAGIPGEAGDRWLFLTMSPTPEHVAALAVRRDGTRIPSISIGPAEILSIKSAGVCKSGNGLSPGI